MLSTKATIKKVIDHIMTTGEVSVGDKIELNYTGDYRVKYAVDCLDWDLEVVHIDAYDLAIRLMEILKDMES